MTLAAQQVTWADLPTCQPEQANNKGVVPLSPIQAGQGNLNSSVPVQDNWSRKK